MREDSSREAGARAGAQPPCTACGAPRARELRAAARAARALRVAGKQRDVMGFSSRGARPPDPASARERGFGAVAAVAGRGEAGAGRGGPGRPGPGEDAPNRGRASRVVTDVYGIDPVTWGLRSCERARRGEHPLLPGPALLKRSL